MLIFDLDYRSQDTFIVDGGCYKTFPKLIDPSHPEKKKKNWPKLWFVGRFELLKIEGFCNIPTHNIDG